MAIATVSGRFTAQGTSNVEYWQLNCCISLFKQLDKWRETYARAYDIFMSRIPMTQLEENYLVQTFHPTFMGISLPIAQGAVRQVRFIQTS